MHLANIKSLVICLSTKLSWNLPDLIGVCFNTMLRIITVALHWRLQSGNDFMQFM